MPIDRRWSESCRSNWADSASSWLEEQRGGGLAEAADVGQIVVVMNFTATGDRQRGGRVLLPRSRKGSGGDLKGVIMRAAILLFLSLSAGACCVCAERGEETPARTAAARQLALAPQGGLASWYRVDMPLDRLERIGPELTLMFRPGKPDPSMIDGFLEVKPSLWSGVVILTGSFGVEDVSVLLDPRDEETPGGRDGFREWHSRTGVTTLIRPGVFYQGTKDELEAALAVREGRAPSVLDVQGVAEILAEVGECDAVAVHSGAPESSEMHLGIPGLDTAVAVAWVPDAKGPMRVQMHWLFESPEAAERTLPKIRQRVSGMPRRGEPEVRIGHYDAHVTVEMSSVIFRPW